MKTGIVCVACSDLGRFTNFSAAMARLARTVDAGIMWAIGPTVADNLNGGCEALLEDEDADWILFLGDDHEWDEELFPVMLERLYEERLDVLVPLCFRRSWPPNYVIYDHEEFGVLRVIKHKTVAEIMASGQWTREVLAAGNAGMLVRRYVIENLEPPWFRNVLIGPEGDIISQAGEDLNFCSDVRRAGYKIHAGFDLPFGHTGVVTFAPEWHPQEKVLGMRMFFGAREGPLVVLNEGVG